MPRPPVKKTLKLAEAQMTGTLRAIAKAHKKKPLEESFREHIGKIIDRIDPLEAIAVIAGTITIHEVLFKMDLFLDDLKKITVLGKDINKIPLASTLWQSFMMALGQSSGSEPKKTPSFIDSDLFLWLVAFGISYYAMKHGQELLAVAKMFFGMVTA